MRRLWAIFLFTCFGILAFAGPARPGKVHLTQPDGTHFGAYIYGDEYLKIKRTETGEAVVQDEDGWWCYARFDSDGRRYSTGIRVGSSAVASEMIQSRNIPYGTLVRNAVRKRAEKERGHLMASRRFSLCHAATDVKDKYGIVILAQFSGEDERFRYTREDFEKMLNEKGYSVNGATGCAKQYFEDQFGNGYTFTFDVTDIVTLGRTRAYYGANDSNEDDQRPEEMIIDACKAVDASVNFAKYDQDGDGEVDNVFVFYAGPDEAAGGSDDCIWSHAWYVKDGAQKDLILDGTVINRYACTSELDKVGSKFVMAGIGTFCHEYSHTLGLPDLYDADYSEGGFAAATWQATALMDGGNYNNEGNTPPYFNAIDREILKLTSPIVISAPGTYELKPVNTGVYYRINTDVEGEYFLLEYRDGTGWDAHVGGEGLLVYHIDKSERDTGYSDLWERSITAGMRWASQVEINSLASHQCADLIEADGRKDKYSNYTDMSYQNLLMSLSGLFFPYKNLNSLTPALAPGLVCWDGAAVNLAVTDIERKDGRMTFNVVRFSGEELPVPVNIVSDVFQDGAIIGFSSSFAFDGKASVEYGPTGEQTRTMTVEPYEDGRWVFELEGLKPMTSYSLKISFSGGGSVGETVKHSFMTKKLVEGMPAYIYLGGTDRNADGTFNPGAKVALKVFNAADAEEVQWKFNGAVISKDKSCYYTIPESGTLSAVVFWEDGSEDVIVKDVKIFD